MSLAESCAPGDLLRVAHDDLDSVVELTSRLVRAPSRGGLDPYDPVLDLLAGWLSDQALTPVELRDNAGRRVGLVCEIQGSRPGPRWVLDACVDTAPFGDESTWAHPPTSAVIEDGWLWGRGSADSKVAAAIFCHLGRSVAGHVAALAGSLVLLFDADEHTGGFAGARRFFDDAMNLGSVGGVFIGYPGFDELVVGSRGVLRAELRVRGVGGHSGARSPGPNAVVKACDLVGVLSESRPGAKTSSTFPLEPRISVTAIHGGEGYTVTPDACTVSVDARTTPSFDATAARQFIEAATETIDRRWRGTDATEVRVVHDWPPYVLEHSCRLRSALVKSAGMFGVQLTPKVSGPSNIGNYLTTLGIPATAGFGVNYRGLHAADERIDITSIPSVQAIYHASVLELLDCELDGTTTKK